MHHLLNDTKHRPYPHLETPWVMTQTWIDLLFAHWVVPAAAIEKWLPNGLKLDQFEGRTYVGVVPFRMSNVRPRFLPAVAPLSEFLELNVRTYVVADDRPGVYFFSLDASNQLAVHVARAWYQLPYYKAKMNLEIAGNSTNENQTQAEKVDGAWIHYSSIREANAFQININSESEAAAAKNTKSDAKSSDGGIAPAACLKIAYRPIGPVFKAEPNSLEAFLTERYCLYVADRNGKICRGEIHHKQWPLQLAEAKIRNNTMCSAFGFDFETTAPILHYSKFLETIEWPIQTI